MKLLAIDCATDACSAALWLDSGPGPRRHAVMRRGHAEALMPMIQAVMQQADLAYGDLSAIAVTVGPGAFTGLRIGLSAARGLALATGRPLIGVTTLEAVAAAQDTQYRPMLIALGSKRADIYVQLFAASGEALAGALAEPQSCLPGNLAQLLPAEGELALAGDAADTALAALAGRVPVPVRLAGPDLPDAAVVARIAARRLLAGVSGLTAPPVPLYLRAPDAIPAAARRAVPRPASPADSPAIAAIAAVASNEPWSAELVARLIAQPGGWAILAGSGASGPGGFVLGRSAAGETEIVNLAVAPECRRRGLGGVLLAAAIHRAAADGSTALFLEVAMDNVAARALYDAAGFRIVGRRPNYYSRGGNTRIDALIMRRDLVNSGSDTGRALDGDCKNS